MHKTSLEEKYKEQLHKAIVHLKYSYNKIKSMNINIDSSSTDQFEEELETWESFTARFARVVDIFLTKYIKLKVKSQDPAFDGTLMDYLNMAEKMGLISDSKRWLATRELRNIQAHDYTDQQLSLFLQNVKIETEFLLKELEG